MLLSNNFFRNAFEELQDDFERQFYGASTRIIEYSNCKKYYTNGILHREDGPAVVYHDSKKPSEYWLNGTKVSKEIVEKAVEEKENNKKYILSFVDEKFEVTGKELKEIKQFIKTKLKK
jgi:hypothetical protein